MVPSSGVSVRWRPALGTATTIERRRPMQVRPDRRSSRGRAGVIAIAFAGLVLTLTAPAVLAHEGREVHGFELVVGFVNEPASRSKAPQHTHGELFTSTPNGRLARRGEAGAATRPRRRRPMASRPHRSSPAAATSSRRHARVALVEGEDGLARRKSMTASQWPGVWRSAAALGRSEGAAVSDKGGRAAAGAAAPAAGGQWRQAKSSCA